MADDNTLAVGALRTSSLAEVNTLVGQQEDDLGPLTGIGNDGQQTVLIFDTDEASPKSHAIIAPDQNGSAIVPAGSTKVCSGKIYIGGILTPCTASRPG